jgi:hypothetical protein
VEGVAVLKGCEKQIFWEDGWQRLTLENLGCGEIKIRFPQFINKYFKIAQGVLKQAKNTGA